MQPTVAVNKAGFSDFNENATAIVDRLVMAASYWEVSESALRTLVHVTALACNSDKVVAATVPAADLDELESRGLALRSAPDTVVLL
jgi:hypothetical protein